MKISRSVFCLALFFLSANSQGASGKKIKRPLKIWVCGDVMTGRGVAPFLNTQHTSLNFWRNQIRSADIAFCNLEGAFGTDRQQLQQREKLRLLLDKRTTQILQNTGFDLVSQANNHALDGGENGLRQLQNALRKSHIETVGANFNNHFQPLRIRVCRQDVTWLAASQWGNFRRGNAHVRALQNSDLIEQVRRLSRRGERVLVSLHWGIEYSKAPTFGQIEVAHALIDAGAFAVIGHHPHVAQMVETYKNRPIFYSLGNFLFDRTPHTQSGIAAMLTLDEKQISWRAFVVKPQAGKAQNVVTQSDAPSLPRRERKVQQTSGHFLPHEKSVQVMIWSKRENGANVLRVWRRQRNRWDVVSQAFPRPILSLQVGDVDGDGNDDLVVELWQRSKLDVAPKRRLHIYNVRDGSFNHSSGFVPRWRGSALSRPFRRWCLVGRNDARSVDLAAIEYSNDPSSSDFEWLSVYRWNGFGVRLLWQTPVRGHLKQLQSGRDAHGAWLRVVKKWNGVSHILILKPIMKAKIVTFRAEEAR